MLSLPRNPLEVSEDFVQQYNNAKDLDEREKYEETAHKMLERSKVLYLIRPLLLYSVTYMNSPECAYYYLT